MHYHASVTITVTADSCDELLAELSLVTAALTRKAQEAADEWMAAPAHPGVQFLEPTASGSVLGVLHRHIDPTEN